MLWGVLVLAAGSLACQPDVLMDDFEKLQHKYIDGANRIVNILGGDYGGSNTVDMTYFAAPKHHGHVRVTPKDPKNYFFFKANPEACFDLSPYTAIQFDVYVDSADADFSITLTQMQSDCKTRVPAPIGDAKYTTVSKFAKLTPGKWHTVKVPLSVFKTNQAGKPFDMVHFKDFTFVDFKGTGNYYMNRFIMVGDCKEGHSKETHNKPKPKVDSKGKVVVKNEKKHDEKPKKDEKAEEGKDKAAEGAEAKDGEKDAAKDGEKREAENTTASASTATEAPTATTETSAAKTETASKTAASTAPSASPSSDALSLTASIAFVFALIAMH